MEKTNRKDHKRTSSYRITSRWNDCFHAMQYWRSSAWVRFTPSSHLEDPGSPLRTLPTSHNFVHFGSRVAHIHRHRKAHTDQSAISGLVSDIILLIDVVNNGPCLCFDWSRICYLLCHVAQLFRFPLKRRKAVIMQKALDFSISLANGPNGSCSANSKNQKIPNRKYKLSTVVPF